MRSTISRRISVTERTMTVEKKVPDYVKEDLRNAFLLFEPIESEGISLSQAQSILWNFGFWKMTNKEFETEMIENNVNLAKSKVSWNELLSIVTKKYHRGGQHRRIRETFEVFDMKNKGTVSINEISQLFRENLEIPVTDGEIFDIFDSELKDLSSISLDDFMKL